MPVYVVTHDRLSIERHPLLQRAIEVPMVFYIIILKQYFVYFDTKNEQYTVVRDIAKLIKVNTVFSTSIY